MNRASIHVFCISVALTMMLGAAAGRALGQNSQASSRSGSVQKFANPLNDLLEEAQGALNRKDFQAAIAPLTKVLAEEPGSAFAHFQLGYAYAGLKRFDDARAEYRRAAELDPKLAEAHLSLGLLLLDQNPADAVAPLRQAAELLPSQCRPRYLLGRALENSGDLAGAAKALRDAQRLGPRDVETLLALGRVLLKGSHAAEAEEEFRAVLVIQPDSAPAYLGLARSLQAQQKPESAEALRKYLELQPDDREARWRNAKLLFDARQYDAVLVELDKLDAPEGAQLASLRLRAEIQEAQGRWNDVVAALRRAVELAPRDAAVRAQLGRVYLHLHDYPSAAKELEVALQLDAGDLPAWQDLSSAYYLAGNCPAALAAFDEVGRRTTPADGVWFVRATCYDKMKRVLEALDAYKKFVELDKNQHPNQTWQALQRIKTLQRIAGAKH